MADTPPGDMMMPQANLSAILGELENFTYNATDYDPRLRHYGNFSLNDSSNGTFPHMRGGVPRNQFPEYRVGVFLMEYGFIFIAVLGFIGNPLSFVVSRQRMNTSSPHFYMTILAFWDFSFLVFKTIFNYKSQLGVHMSETGCKIFYFLFPYTSHCAVWTLVAMTFERFVAIWFPWKMTSQFAVKRAKITVAIIAICLFGLNIHVMWTYHAAYTRSGDVACRMIKEYVIVWDWIDNILYSFGPFLGIIALNIMIIIGLRNKEKKLGSIRKQSRDTSQARMQRQITVMLLTVAMAFAILTGPKCILALVSKYWNTEKFTQKDRVVSFLVFIIFDKLEDLQHCINFYLYFLTGRNFRKELMELLPRKCAERTQRPQQSEYTVMTTIQQET